MSHKLAYSTTVILKTCVGLVYLGCDLD